MLMGSLWEDPLIPEQRRMHAPEPCFSRRAPAPRSHLGGSSASPDLSLDAPGHSRWTASARAALAVNANAGQRARRLTQYREQRVRRASSRGIYRTNGRQWNHRGLRLFTTTVQKRHSILPWDTRSASLSVRANTAHADEEPAGQSDAASDCRTGRVPRRGA